LEGLGGGNLTDWEEMVCFPIGGEDENVKLFLEGIEIILCVWMAGWIAGADPGCDVGFM
jgi:hypothetical protein